MVQENILPFDVRADRWFCDYGIDHLGRRRLAPSFGNHSDRGRMVPGVRVRHRGYNSPAPVDYGQSVSGLPIARRASICSATVGGIRAPLSDDSGFISRFRRGGCYCNLVAGIRAGPHRY